jgi:hypothetical protein
MRERLTLEREVSLLELPASGRSNGYDLELPLAFEKATARSADPLDAFRIRGGLYSATEKTSVLKDPKGFLLTADVVMGKEERRIIPKGPTAIAIGRTLTRFEDGKLGDFIENYNAFTLYSDDILHAIGRLRDLLSVGAPEAPHELTRAQVRSLQRTNDAAPTVDKKSYYGQWRLAQEAYIKSIYKVVNSSLQAGYQRAQYWGAQEKFRETLSKKLDKPTFDAIDFKLSDLHGLATAGPVVGTSMSVVGSVGIAGLVLLGDLIIDARKKRQEYDAQMRRFEEQLKRAKAEATTDYFNMRNFGKAYWDLVEQHAADLKDREERRKWARFSTALLGQKLAVGVKDSQKALLAEIRMPEMVSDAWHTLAVVGPHARSKLSKALAAAPVVSRAMFHYQKSRPDPFENEDITRVVNAWRTANRWKAILTKEEVQEWIAMEKLWIEFFNKFNV